MKRYKPSTVASAPLLRGAALFMTALLCSGQTHENKETSPDAPVPESIIKQNHELDLKIQKIHEALIRIVDCSHHPTKPGCEDGGGSQPSQESVSNSSKSPYGELLGIYGEWIGYKGLGGSGGILIPDWVHGTASVTPSMPGDPEGKQYFYLEFTPDGKYKLRIGRGNALWSFRSGAFEIKPGAGSKTFPYLLTLKPDPSTIATYPQNDPEQLSYGFQYSDKEHSFRLRPSTQIGCRTDKCLEVLDQNESDEFASVKLHHLINTAGK